MFCKLYNTFIICIYIFKGLIIRLILLKTFGRLSTRHYFRQLAFGAIFLIPFLYVATHEDSFPFNLILIFVVNTFLYPYARFVYESIAGFILGDNLFIMNMKFLIIFKLITMALCWSMAIIIAPFGLGYLYYLNCTKA